MGLSNLDGLETKKIKITEEGGIAIKLTNKTGADTVKGTLVCTHTTIDSAVEVESDEYDTIGVFLDSGIPDGEEAWVTIYGMAEVLLADGKGSTSGNWVISDEADGRADATQPTPPNASTLAELQEHFKEVGHCLETKEAGTNVLVKCILHFN